ncbi:protein PYRICULARIA ORYZAE RESISTANCE 21-like isoform X1 [Triticum urartu]|nr:protein PYRICULARIA ORYZAE RESISTANCE 21-like isoform X1 [Triticum urartu]
MAFKTDPSRRDLATKPNANRWRKHKHLRPGRTQRPQLHYFLSGIYLRTAKVFLPTKNCKGELTSSSSAKKMPTLCITVDMGCSRCTAKIQRVLSTIQDRGKFVIEKIVYEDNRVLVSGPFDADKLTCKLWCKASNVIKNIEVVKPPVVAKPKDDPPKPAPCNQLVPYAYPLPYPLPYPSACPCGCATSYCECHSKPPPPAPAPAPTCQCPAWSSCHCHTYPPYQQPMPMPCTPMVICEESPPACTVM